MFKKERELEVWAAAEHSGPLTHLATYTICAASGGPGPKTAEGDYQVPEGVYTIDGFNPRSKYHLSMHVDYPNARDRRQRSTGSHIMIHGDCLSVGCVAIGDERIEELWLIARALKGARPRIHAYPGRNLARFIESTEDKDLAEFWRGIQEVKAAFENDHELPRVRPDKAGIYRVVD